MSNPQTLYLDAQLFYSNSTTAAIEHEIEWAIMCERARVNSIETNRRQTSATETQRRQKAFSSSSIGNSIGIGGSERAAAAAVNEANCGQSMSPQMKVAK